MARGTRRRRPCCGVHEVHHHPSWPWPNKRPRLPRQAAAASPPAGRPHATPPSTHPAPPTPSPIRRAPTPAATPAPTQRVRALSEAGGAQYIVDRDDDHLEDGSDGGEDDEDPALPGRNQEEDTSTARRAELAARRVVLGRTLQAELARQVGGLRAEPNDADASDADEEDQDRDRDDRRSFTTASQPHDHPPDTDQEQGDNADGDEQQDLEAPDADDPVAHELYRRVARSEPDADAALLIPVARDMLADSTKRRYASLFRNLERFAHRRQMVRYRPGLHTISNLSADLVTLWIWCAYEINKVSYHSLQAMHAAVL